MTYLSIQAPATIAADNHKNLIGAWRMYGPDIVGTYIIRKQLTDSQLRRLPSELRARLRTEEEES